MSLGAISDNNKPITISNLTTGSEEIGMFTYDELIASGYTAQDELIVGKNAAPSAIILGDPTFTLDNEVYFTANEVSIGGDVTCGVLSDLILDDKDFITVNGATLTLTAGDLIIATDLSVGGTLTLANNLTLTAGSLDVKHAFDIQGTGYSDQVVTDNVQKAASDQNNGTLCYTFCNVQDMSFPPNANTIRSILIWPNPLMATTVGDSDDNRYYRIEIFGNFTPSSNADYLTLGWTYTTGGADHSSNKRVKTWFDAGNLENEESVYGFPLFKTSGINYGLVHNISAVIDLDVDGSPVGGFNFNSIDCQWTIIQANTPNNNYVGRTGGVCQPSQGATIKQFDFRTNSNTTDGWEIRVKMWGYGTPNIFNNP